MALTSSNDERVLRAKLKLKIPEKMVTFCYIVLNLSTFERELSAMIRNQTI